MPESFREHTIKGFNEVVGSRCVGLVVQSSIIWMDDIRGMTEQPSRYSAPPSVVMATRGRALVHGARKTAFGWMAGINCLGNSSYWKNVIFFYTVFMCINHKRDTLYKYNKIILFTGSVHLHVHVFYFKYDEQHWVFTEVNILFVFVIKYSTIS